MPANQIEEKFCPRGTVVQTLIFDKAQWSAREAKKWAKAHGFKSVKVDEKSASWRLRQKPISRFRENSFRTIVFRGIGGVKAVVACPKLKQRKSISAVDVLKGMF